MGGVVCCTSILVVFVIHNHKSRNLVGPLYDGCNKCGDFILGFHCQLLFTVVVIQLGSVFFVGIKIWCFFFCGRFIYSFMGVGILLCCLTLVGCIAAELIHGCCLCFVSFNSMYFLCPAYLG